MKDGFPEVGDTLTLASDIISVSGHLTFTKGQKVEIREVEIRKGYWSKLCPDIWVKPELGLIKLKDVYGCWIPDAFVETKKVTK